MSMMLGLMFGLCGIAAFGTLLLTWRRFAPAIAGLREERRAPPVPHEIRTTLLEHVLIRLRPNRGPLRHRHRPKPITHRLNGPRPRRAAA